MNQETSEFQRKTSRARQRHRLGSRVAGLLAGVWREDSSATPVNLSETELTQITPLLCASGSAALAWYRLRNTPLADTVSGRELREVYRQSRLSALVHEREIVYVFSLLRNEGIEPVLVKGWAVARHYPDRALRPYGDIDLCVRPDQYAAAAKALKCLEEIDGHYVDLHCGFDRIGKVQPVVQSPMSKVQSPEAKRGLWTLDFGLWTNLFSRSQVVMLNGEPIRVLGAEDHLRLLCQHLMRSGARRPPWLVDIALLVEEVSSSEFQVPSSKLKAQRHLSEPPALAGGSSTARGSNSVSDVIQRPKTQVQSPNFNWSVCLGDDPVQSNWVASAIGLAHELLDANVDHTPFANAELPRWLASAVLQQWGGRVKSPVQSPMSKVQSQESSRRLWTLDLGHWTELYSRWDNPIRATAAVGGEFNNWPRLPYRLAESIKRAVS